MKKVTYISLASISMALLGGMVVFNPASALTYEDRTNVQFTFNSTLSVALSEDSIAIENLIPGQTGVSEPIDVIVNTNNVWGYRLSATVGSAAKNYRELKHTNGVSSLASLAVNSNLTDIPTDGDSVWGFSKTTDGNVWAKYNGLPKYDDAVNTAELNFSTGAAENSVTGFKIGAYAVEGQISGDYSNVVNFIAVSNVGKTYIQDVTWSICNTDPMVVYDVRDEEPYTIQRLADGNCWLLDNLRLDLSTIATLTPASSNVSANWTVPADIASWENTHEAAKSNSDSKNVLMSYGSGSGKVGVYYNFCAATAGSYCMNWSSGSGDASQDVCPKGWRLPTGGDSGEYSKLFASYSNNSLAFKDTFRAPLAGYYYSGSAGYQGTAASSWASTFQSGSSMYALTLGTSSVNPFGYDGREHGFTIRCILNKD